MLYGCTEYIVFTLGLIIISKLLSNNAYCYDHDYIYD